MHQYLQKFESYRNRIKYEPCYLETLVLVPPPTQSAASVNRQKRALSDNENIRSILSGRNGKTTMVPLIRKASFPRNLKRGSQH